MDSDAAEGDRSGWGLGKGYQREEVQAHTTEKQNKFENSRNSEI